MDINDIFEYMIVVLVTIGILIFLYATLRGSSEMISYEFSEAYFDNAREDFLVFLRTPVESIDLTISEKISMNTRISLPLEEMIFTIPTESEGVIFEVASARGSNIAYMPGTDDISLLLEEKGAYPLEISWDKLTAEYDHLFMGCKADLPLLPAEESRLKGWLNNGGTIITTDHSIEAVEPFIPVYSAKVNSKSTEDIATGFFPEFTASGVFWEFDTTGDVLSRFTHSGIPAIASNQYGNGRSVHLGFHLSDTCERGCGKLIENLFIFSGNHPQDFSMKLHSGENVIATYERQGEFRQEEFIFSDLPCEKFPCDLKLSLAGQGDVVIREAMLVKGKKDYLAGKDILDVVVESYMADDYTTLQYYFNPFAKSHDTSSMKYSISVFDGDKEVFKYKTDHFSRLSLIQSVDVPLPEPGKSLSLRLYRSEAST